MAQKNKDTSKVDDTKDDPTKQPEGAEGVRGGERGEEMVPSNAGFTAPVPNQPAGIDPQPALDMPLSGDPTHQMPGGGYYGSTVTSDSARSATAAMHKLMAYVDAIVPTSPDSRVVFGHGANHITMGDLRTLVNDTGFRQYVEDCKDKEEDR